MIPIRDNVATRGLAFVTGLLIIANCRVFAHELALGPQIDDFILRFGLVPARFRPEQLFSSMFLHGGWLHIISNMWVLFIFGRTVESRIGHFRYLFLYLACGVLAGVTQLWSYPGSSVPTVGASGAIAGVMGAYFLLYPFARISTLVFFFIFMRVIELPAFFFLGFWFLTQLYSGSYAIGRQIGGIAWWAHIGGFVAGMALVPALLPGKKKLFR